MKKNSARKHLIIIISLIVIFCAYRTYEKIYFLGFSFKPNELKQVWAIESEIKFTANNNTPISVTLAIPQSNNNLRIFRTENNGKSAGFLCQNLNIDGLNKVQWTKKEATGNQSLYYKMFIYNVYNNGIEGAKNLNFQSQKPAWEGAKLQAAMSIIETAKKDALDEYCFTKNVINQFFDKNYSDKIKFLLPAQNVTSRIKIDTVRNILALNNIPTALVFTLNLNNENRNQTPILYLAFKGGDTIYYSNMQDANNYELPSNILVFSTNTDYISDVKGGYNSKITYSVSKQTFSLDTLLAQQARSQGINRILSFSIYNLPISEQNTFKKLSVLPLAILMLVVMRNLVGLQGMGTFTPILVSMVFLETELIPGIIIFTSVLTLGLLIRSYLSKLNLLLVPRISAVVIVVIAIMQFVSTISYHFAIYDGLKVTFFPLIIFAWIIERSSIIWEEEGAKKTLKQLFFCLLTAIASYYIISNSFISHTMYVFNEFILIILVLILLIGSYSGYRLTELYRFRSFFLGEKDVK